MKTTRRCYVCEGFPPAEEVGIRVSGHEARKARARVYEALRQSIELTPDELREAAWAGSKSKRNPESINILISRLQQVIKHHDILIVRVAGQDGGGYRLMAGEPRWPK